MYLGIYEFTGDPDALIPAYQRLMASMPPGNTTWHLCARRPEGLVIYDTCPSEEVFQGFSTSPGFLGAITAAGLPRPAVTGLPVVSARSS